MIVPDTAAPPATKPAARHVAAAPAPPLPPRSHWTGHARSAFSIVFRHSTIAYPAGATFIADAGLYDAINATGANVVWGA